MARYAGKLGVKKDPVETAPGIYTESIATVQVVGTMRTESVRWRGEEFPHETPTANHLLSIIAAESAIEELTKVVYVEWQGRKWAVKSVEYIRPRFSIRLGGLYNG